MSTLMNSSRRMEAKGTFELDPWPGSALGGGGCERRDHDSGCKSRMRRRTEGGIECGYSGIVTAASRLEFVTAITKYARLYTSAKRIEQDKLIHTIYMTWEYSPHFCASTSSPRLNSYHG
jgi:hypothetical protein